MGVNSKKSPGDWPGDSLSDGRAVRRGRSVRSPTGQRITRRVMGMLARAQARVGALTGACEACVCGRVCGCVQGRAGVREERVYPVPT